MMIIETIENVQKIEGEWGGIGEKGKGEGSP